MLFFPYPCNAFNITFDNILPCRGNTYKRWASPIAGGMKINCIKPCSGEINNIMPGQSLVKNYLHIVFSTKYRQPLIKPPVEELHAYIAGICNNLDCTAIKVGGYTDHVHILCRLSKKITLIKLMQEMKGQSSKWMKTKGVGYENFYWQDGYGAFSVNPAQVDNVIAYIANQHAHHDRKAFKDEYRQFLHKYKVEYDERYVWD